jgi:hypothetical protein
MTRATRWALGLVSVLGVSMAFGARSAWAEPPNPKATPVYVLSIQTEDADDQAEALTQALRSRVRQVQGWSLLESQQSFETLAIALKCPPRPDQPCLQRIADQLHADHYVWGAMSKKKEPGQVTAELHLWTRGRGNTDAGEGYTENLKEASDPTLLQIASRLFGALTGGVGGGTLVIHAGTGGGTILIDGIEKGTLEGGVARVDVGGGAHTVAVRVAGFEAPLQQTSVSVGAEQEVAFTLAPVGGGPLDAGAHSSFPLRKVASYTALAAGVGLLVAGGVEGLAWMSDSNASKNDRKNVPTNITDVCVDEVNQSAVDACQKSKNALTVSTLAWVFTGVGVALAGTGIYLLASDGGGSSEPHEPGLGKTKLQVVPAVGTRGGTVDLRVTF